MVIVHQLTFPAPPALCHRGCGAPAEVEVVDLPDVAQGDHLATLVGALAQIDQPSTLALCASCAGEPEGWDAYRPIAISEAA